MPRRRGRRRADRGASYWVCLAVVCAIMLGACGASDRSTRAASTSDTARGLDFSRCMRSHGVSSFPDPGARLPAGLDPRSPAFQAAQQACHSLSPKQLPQAEHTSAGQRRAALRFARCMRGRGYPSFPDPSPSPPANGSGTVLGAFGVYFVFRPGMGIPPHSAAFLQGAARCGVNPQR